MLQKTATAPAVGPLPAFVVGLLLLLILIGCSRISLGYSVFSETVDENLHIAAGLKLLDADTSGTSLTQSPLARMLLALGPYYEGARYLGFSNIDNISAADRKDLERLLNTVSPGSLDQLSPQEQLSLAHLKMLYGTDALRNYAQASTIRRLLLARVTVLPFFIALSLLVFVWTAELYGKPAGLVAVLLFTNLPPILTHSGLATTDLIFTAICTFTIYIFTHFLKKPSFSSSVRLGVLIGLSILAKYSAVIFLPIAILILLGVKITSEQKINRPSLYMLSQTALSIGGAIFLTVWAGHGFSINSISVNELGLDRPINLIFGESGWLHDQIYRIFKLKIFPCTEVIEGLTKVHYHFKHGHPAYLLVQLSPFGWWYFFPLTILVKTPLAFLLLTLFGAVYLVLSKDEEQMSPVLLFVGMLLIVLPSQINLGVRHVLILYPFLSMIAAYGVIMLTKKITSSFLRVSLITGLITWQIASSLFSHPDYLPYTNELSYLSSKPILGDSDLDWGQDAFRLRNALERADFDSISLAISFHPTLEKFLTERVPNVRKLIPYEKPSGWLAINIDSINRKRGFFWLKDQQAKMRIGKTIYFYYIEPEDRSEKPKE